jgi:PPM family protein phosphatase
VRLELSVLSKPGGRRVNEDACGVWSSEATGACYCVVSDGAGGHGGGDVASKLVVERVLGWFQRQPEVSGEAIAAALAAANQSVIDLQQRDERLANMRATAVVLAVDAQRMLACWGHLGDSRLYCFRRGRVIVQTRDHSVVQTMVDAGFVEPAELRNNARRNALLAALGQEEGFSPKVERERHAIQAGDVGRTRWSASSIWPKPRSNGCTASKTRSSRKRRKATTTTPRLQLPAASAYPT